MSTLSDLAGALRCDLAELLTAAAPSRRADLELQLEQAQRSPSFESLGVRPVRPGPSLPLDALECLVALHDGSRRLKRRATRRRSMRAAPTPSCARGSVPRTTTFSASRNWPATLHDRATPGDGPVTRHRINAIAEYLGFTLHLVGDVPSSTRSVTDLRNRRIFLRGSIDGATQRSLALAALGHLVLDHRPPQDYAEFLAQRVEVNYFAAAVLMPQGWAVPFLQQAKHDRDLEIDDLRDRYLVSYEMAAHRFTNLATTHLDIGVHFMKINRAGIIHKAYANDGVALPTDPGGSVEGQRVCRFWTARQVFEQQDWNQPYQQYTDTPTGTFWCTAVAEQAEREAYSVAVGTPYEQVKWFRGRGTPHRSRSTCPDPACCTLPPPRPGGPVAGFGVAQCAGAFESAREPAGRCVPRRRPDRGTGVPRSARCTVICAPT